MAFDFVIDNGRVVGGGRTQTSARRMFLTNQTEILSGETLQSGTGFVEQLEPNREGQREIREYLCDHVASHSFL